MRRGEGAPSTISIQLCPLKHKHHTPPLHSLNIIHTQNTNTHPTNTATLLILKKGPKQSPEPQLAQIGGIQDSIWSTVLKRQQGEGQEVLVSREAIRQVGEAFIRSVECQ